MQTIDERLVPFQYALYRIATAKQRTPQAKVQIHQSDVNAFVHCPLAWWWGSRQGLDLEPSVSYEPFYLGSGFHRCLERFAFWEGRLQGSREDDYNYLMEQLDQYVQETRTELLPEGHVLYELEQETIRGAVDLIRRMLWHYVLWERNQQGDLALSSFDVISVEQNFTMPIVNPATGEISEVVEYVGTWDNIMRAKSDGRLWIGEYKTTRSIDQRLKQLELEYQTSFYLNAARQIFGEAGLEVGGVMYTLFKKAVPPFPKLIAGGTELSQAISSGGQTFEWYLDCLRKHYAEAYAAGQEQFRAAVAPYLTTLYTLRQQSNSYFLRVPKVRTEAALQLAQRELWDFSHAIVATADHVAQTHVLPSRYMSDRCNWCIFRQPCITRQDGGDYHLELNMGYKVSDHGDK